ncbi:MAG: RusA family crossover junction endodeoxyribonuclease [Synergistaceae bacterium]|nr:RusA family crossover junction endodeoxyribonuclease [Synergistaceae bacterium]
MSMIFRLEIEGLPPSVNSMYRTGKFSARYKRPEVAEWQEELTARMRECWNKPLAYMDVVEVHVLFTVKDNRRWDVDNRLKALLDCLSMAGVIHDDSQIWGIVALRVKGEYSRTRIEVREYTGMRKKSA